MIGDLGDFVKIDSVVLVTEAQSCLSGKYNVKLGENPKIESGFSLALIHSLAEFSADSRKSVLAFTSKGNPSILVRFVAILHLL